MSDLYLFDSVSRGGDGSPIFYVNVSLVYIAIKPFVRSPCTGNRSIAAALQVYRAILILVNVKYFECCQWLAYSARASYSSSSYFQ